MKSIEDFKMKITDLKVWVTAPEKNGRSFVYVQIDTDAGIHGIGEATSSGGGGSGKTRIGAIEPLA